jgi:hypothetical protein
MDEQELKQIEAHTVRDTGPWIDNFSYQRDVPRLVQTVRQLTAANVELRLEVARLAAEREALRDALDGDTG